MKKTIFALLTAAALLLALCSCSANDGAKSLSEVYNDIKAQVSFSDFNEFSSAAELDRYYGITEEQIQEFAGGVNNTGVEQEEIVLIKAADNSAADSIKTALDNRYDAKLNQNRNYNPEQAEIIERCTVERNGLYVSMIVSENADKITGIYKTDLGL